MKIAPSVIPDMPLIERKVNGEARRLSHERLKQKAFDDVNLLPFYLHLQGTQPVHRGFRSGNTLHSLSDISNAQYLLCYASTQLIDERLALAMPWYVLQEK